MTDRDDSNRITGRRLQARRLRIWSQDPHCARCRKLTRFPDGFELDHKQALFKGGEDTDENSQILCAGPEGCHAIKTAEDLGRKHDPAPQFIAGRVVW